MNDLHSLLQGTDRLPWCPVEPGFSLKLLRGNKDEDTRVLLLRLEPGTVIGLHRHEGEVHALNLAGERELDTGMRVGPGGYVYEPAGNVDSWKAVGTEPVIVFVTVRGAMESLDAEGRVTERTTTGSLATAYRRFCAEHAAANVDAQRRTR